MGATEAVPGVPAELGPPRAALHSQGQEAPGCVVTSLAHPDVCVPPGLAGCAAGPGGPGLPCSAVLGGRRWAGAACDQGRKRGQGAALGHTGWCWVSTGLPAGTAALETPEREEASAQGGAGQGGQSPGRDSSAHSQASHTDVRPHLTGVGSLDSLSGQRLGLESPRVPVLGQALPCIQGCHAHRPGGGHAHEAHARGAHQPSHAGGVHAAGNAGPPGASMLQELAVKRLSSPHLGREEGPSRPGHHFECPVRSLSVSSCRPPPSQSLGLTAAYAARTPHRQPLSRLLTVPPP